MIVAKEAGTIVCLATIYASKEMNHVSEEKAITRSVKTVVNEAMIIVSDATAFVCYAIACVSDEPAMGCPPLFVIKA